jgi:hypothetical protein
MAEDCSRPAYQRLTNRQEFAGRDFKSNTVDRSRPPLRQHSGEDARVPAVETTALPTMGISLPDSSNGASDAESSHLIGHGR